MSGSSCDSEAAACLDGHPAQGDQEDGGEGKRRKKKRIPARFELCSSDIHDHGWQRAESTPPSTPTPSPTPSPTSSLRRKFVFTMPGIMRPKKPREYKLRGFVAIMGFLMILMVSYAYVHHHQFLLQMQQVMIGERIKFDEKTRIIHVMNAEREVVLHGHLGRGLPEDRIPYACPSTAIVENATLCLNWYMMASLAISQMPDENEAKLTKCYKVEWQAIEEDVVLEDCYVTNTAHWFGIGETNPQHLNFENLTFDYTDMQTANLSVGTFGTVMERYWLSSAGVVIIVDPYVPLEVRQMGNHVCFKAAKGSSYPYFVPSKASDRTNHMPFLSYTICTSSDILTVHKHVSAKLKPQITLNDQLGFMLDNVIWSTRQKYGDAINKSVLSDYVEAVLGYDATRTGVLLVERGWQENEGDLRFDVNRFPNYQDFIRIVHNKGFRVVLGVNPYISTKSGNYHKFLDEGWWVRDITGKVPSLTYWDNLSSVVMVDFTNPKAGRWFGGMLKVVHSKYNVDGFQFCGGESSSIPPYHTTKEPLVSQDRYAVLYNDIAAKTGNMFSTCVVTQSYSAPGFVQLSPRKADWDSGIGLQSLIPAILTVGLLGHPFVMLGPVGGEIRNGSGVLPDRELFIRWMEISSFLPVLQFSVLPSEYDKETENIAKEYMALRRTLIVPLLKIFVDEAARDRVPLIRPVWWLSPNDTEAMTVKQQFLIGDRMMVAGVVNQGAKHCDIFMPPGMWKDRNGALHKGGKWIYNYPAELGKIAYFTLVDHNM